METKIKNTIKSKTLVAGEACQPQNQQRRQCTTKTRLPIKNLQNYGLRLSGPTTVRLRSNHKLQQQANNDLQCKNRVNKGVTLL